MLEWFPEDRATAKNMLDHPWLKMPANYDYKMTDAEYEKISEQIKKETGLDSTEEKIEMAELIESDYELNFADNEDNSDDDIESDFDDDKKNNIQGSGVKSAPYVDKGANPQFLNIVKSKNNLYIGPITMII